MSEMEHLEQMEQEPPANASQGARAEDSGSGEGRLGRGGAIVFIVVAALLCLIPSVGLLFGGGDEAVSDADAAAAPILVEEDGSINLRVLSDAGDWFDDHFAFRNALVTLAAEIEGGLFGVSPNESVVRGTDGWLYYGDSVDDFRGTNQLNDRQLYDIAHSLKLVQNYTLGRGISFACTIAPNKATLYGDNMPYYYQIKAGPTNLDRIVDVLRGEGVNYVDARTLLEGLDESDGLDGALYHARDSHWNNVGAAAVSDALLDALGHPHKDYADEPYEVREDFVGDLDKMLFPAAPTPEDEAYYVNEPSFEYETEDVQSNFDPKIETSSTAGSGNLVMYRDSFGNTLLPFMAEAFGSAYFSRGVPYQLAIDLPAHDADALVIERAERFMRDMAANPPMMPAPLLLGESVPAGDYAEAADVSEKPQGDYLVVTGRVPEGVQAGQRIAVRLNGELVYEAFGMSDAETGEEGFQLLVPKSVARESGNSYELLIW